ncbi:MAG: cytochrome P450, partial [Microthrixaceae bacterium]
MIEQVLNERSVRCYRPVMSLTFNEPSSAPIDEAGFASADFTDPHTFDDPWALYEWLRNLEHLHFDEVNKLYIAPRHEDVFHVSRETEFYVSGEGVRPAVAGDMSIITLDGPEHVAQRRLINQGFTPRQVRQMVPHMRELANQIIDEIAERGEIDFVEDFAMHVPLIIICELMGLDPEKRKAMYRWSDDMMAGDGHVDAGNPYLERAAEAFGEYVTMCIELIAQRRAEAAAGKEGEDLISVLTRAFDAGELAKDHVAASGVDEETYARLQAEHDQLDDNDLLAFLAVLLVAGNETTRNAISGGLIALSENPAQRQALIDNIGNDEFMATAVDELIRYVTPVLGFVRTVTQDHTYRNTELKAGDRVLMLYASANRDDRAIERPDELDLSRASDHMAFGIGPHFCLGANIARAEVRTVFEELFTRLPDISVPEGTAIARGGSTLVLSIEEVPANFMKCPVAH